MSYKFLLYLFICISISCGSSKRTFADLKSADCQKYTFGRIEAKRLLTEADKAALIKSGLHIQEFIFENQYLGSWETASWVNKKLDKTAIKNLIPFNAQDKLSSGMLVSELKRISELPGSSIVLIQTISTIDQNELRQFGEIVFNRDNFYRLDVEHAKLMGLLEYPCIRLLSVVKETLDPDRK